MRTGDTLTLRVLVSGSFVSISTLVCHARAICLVYYYTFRIDAEPESAMTFREAGHDRHKETREVVKVC